MSNPSSSSSSGPYSSSSPSNIAGHSSTVGGGRRSGSAGVARGGTCRRAGHVMYCFGGSGAGEGRVVEGRIFGAERYAGSEASFGEACLRSAGALGGRARPRSLAGAAAAAAVVVAMVAVGVRSLGGAVGAGLRFLSHGRGALPKLGPLARSVLVRREYECTLQSACLSAAR